MENAFLKYKDLVMVVIKKYTELYFLFNSKSTFTIIPVKIKIK